MSARSIVAAGLLAATVAGGHVLLAQKGPKTLAATGTFRCSAGFPGEPCAGVDHVRDDGSGPYDELSGGEGSQVNTEGEYYLFLQTGGVPRKLTVDLGAAIGASACQLAGDCYYQTAWSGSEIEFEYGWLRTNVLEPDTVTTLKGGMMALPCATPRLSRALITFTNATAASPTGTYSFGLRYFADEFYPSNFVQITRHTRTSFTIEAPEGAATAVLIGNRLIRGKFLADSRQEGVFDMPFKLNVTVPGAPAKAGCGE